MPSSDRRFFPRYAFLAVLWTAAAFCVVPSASAQFEFGDVIVSMSQGVGTPPDTESWIKVYTPSGLFKSQIALPSRFQVDELSFHNGTLFGLAGEVYRIDPSGNLTYSGFGGPFVFDRAGNVYTSRNQQIDKYDPAGTFINSWSLPNVAGYLDLASDQCTLYYISYSGTSSEIARFNVCTSQPLPSLITGLPQVGLLGNLRILPGNDVLLGTNNGVLRISPNGQIIRTYAATRQLALDPDRRSFWVGGAGDRVLKIDLESGAVAGSTTPYPCCFTVHAVSVVGEPRAALSPEVAIPTMSQWLLVALAITVASVGFWRLRS